MKPNSKSPGEALSFLKLIASITFFTPMKGQGGTVDSVFQAIMTGRLKSISLCRPALDNVMKVKTFKLFGCTIKCSVLRRAVKCVFFNFFKKAFPVVLIFQMNRTLLLLTINILGPKFINKLLLQKQPILYIMKKSNTRQRVFGVLAFSSLK